MIWEVTAVPAVAAAATDLDRAGARELLARELARREYQSTEQPWVQRLWSWVLDLFDRLRVPDLSGSGIGTVVVVLLLVGAAVAVFVLVGRPRRRARARPAEVFGEQVLSAADHARLADAAAAAGRWREAVTERFRALTRSLVERDLISPRPGRTAHEVAEDAAVLLPGAGRELRRAARIFDDVRYGGHAASAATDAELRELHRAVAGTRPVLPELSEPIELGDRGGVSEPAR